MSDLSEWRLGLSEAVAIAIPTPEVTIRSGDLARKIFTLK